MMNIKLRQNLILAASVVVMALPLILLGGYIVQKHQWAQARIAELEPRYARLLGLEQQGSDIEAALARAQAARAQNLYPADQEAAQAGNAAQQRIRDIFPGAGLQISSSQVLPAKAEKGFDRIPVSVRAEGDLLALQSALMVLGSQVPIIVIDEMEIQVRSAPPNVEPHLAVLFNVSVLKGRS